MADDIIKSVTPTVPAPELSPSAAAAANKGAENAAAMGQQEFLTLLVNQLQQQDPLDPMKSEEFAVQLAQFSQLEQLIEINGKLEGGQAPADSGGVASMASYLGTEVVLKDGLASMQGGSGSNILVDVPAGTQSLRVDFINQNGTTVGRVSLDDVEVGNQKLALEDVNVPDGEYGVRVVSVDSNGSFVDLDAKVTNTVQGFVLEPEPRLLVGGREVALDDVAEVRQG